MIQWKMYLSKNTVIRAVSGLLPSTFGTISRLFSKFNDEVVNQNTEILQVFVTLQERLDLGL